MRDSCHPYRVTCCPSDSRIHQKQTEALAFKKYLCDLFLLVSREGTNVVLLERSSLAYGATGRNGGFVVAGPAEPYQDAIQHLGHETAQAATRLTYENQALLRQVLEEENIKCDYQEPGTVRLAVTELQLEGLKEEAKALQADNFSAYFIDRNQVQTFIKTPLSSEILGGQFLPNQGLVHSAKLVQGLVLAALQRGAKACHTEVLKLTQNSNCISIQTISGSLTAKAIIVATNIWTSKLLPQFNDIIVPWREQMLAHAPTEPIFTTGITADLTTAEYWRQTLDGTILIGGCGSIEESESLGAWESTITTKVQNSIEQVLPRLFPKLTQLHVTQRWAGLLDCTTDNFPIVDQVPEMPGAFIAVGFSATACPLQ